MGLTVTALAAIYTSATGSLLTAAGTVAEAGGSESNLPALVQGGGSAAAVAGLVYVARLIIKGDLQPRTVRDAEAEMAAALATTARRELELQKLLGEALAREQTLTRLNGEMSRTNADVTAEMRYWRDQRQKQQRGEST